MNVGEVYAISITVPKDRRIIIYNIKKIMVTILIFLIHLSNRKLKIKLGVVFIF